jgi:hypothetical protein
VAVDYLVHRTIGRCNCRTHLEPIANLQNAHSYFSFGPVGISTEDGYRLSSRGRGQRFNKDGQSLDDPFGFDQKGGDDPWSLCKFDEGAGLAGRSVNDGWESGIVGPAHDPSRPLGGFPPDVRASTSWAADHRTEEEPSWRAPFLATVASQDGQATFGQGIEVALGVLVSPCNRHRGSGLSVRREDQRSVVVEDPPVAADHDHVVEGRLAVAALSAALYHRFRERRDTPKVVAAELPAARIGRERSAGAERSAGHERASLPFGAEPVILQSDHDGKGVAVVDLGLVDIVD